MKNNLAFIQDILHRAAVAAGFEVASADIHLERPKTLEHGHVSCNLAMVLAGQSGGNPRAIAERLVAALKDESITKTEIAGPGFINLWVRDGFYQTELSVVVTDLDVYLRSALELGGKAKTMVIDYSHPNIAKPMGVHHLLSTILGDSIKRIYRKLGWTVVADNFIGDMGTQFGKVIHAIKKWGNMEEIERDPINALLKLYVQFHFEAESDVELDDEARAEYKKFEDGDAENRALWKKIVQWSLAEIQPTYDRLGVTFDHLNGESFYEEKMAAILKDGRDKGVFVDGDRGAWIVPSPSPDEPPVLVRRSDGASLYMTRDLARIRYWQEAFHPELMVNVVDVAQSLHFRQLFYVAEKLALTPARNVHVAFGRMQFKDGAMSTRKGNILRMTEVLDEAEARALKLAQEKGLELTPEEVRELARVMGIGAIKYNILSQNRVSNITFDWDTMLSFDGNSAPYLMYTAARAKSVLRKSGATDKEIAGYALQLGSDHESRLALDVVMAPQAVGRAAEEFKPNHIANFLYSLASDFNAFYNGTSILQADTEAQKKSRLLLTAATARLMGEGLALLGIETPEKM